MTPQPLRTLLGLYTVKTLFIWLSTEHTMGSSFIDNANILAVFKPNQWQQEGTAESNTDYLPPNVAWEELISI
jgi:hypothetical protein